MSYETVLKLTKEMFTLKSIMEILEWEQEVTMPKGAIVLRGQQMAVSSALIHETLISDELDKALGEAEKQSDLDEYQKANLRELHEERRREINVPTELIEEIAKTAPVAHQIWAEAKRKSDFRSFAPKLEEMLELQKRKAGYIDNNKDPYEVLIQDYEPGAKAADLREQFDLLRAHIVPLLSKIKASGIVPDRSFKRKSYGPRKQEKLNLKLAKKLCFNFDHGRLDGRADEAFHPFTAGTGPDDVRITTRFNIHDPLEGISSTIHEVGHALYEQGLPKEHMLTPVGTARSFGVHESQSRLWENHVSRSLPFWEFFFPELQKTFSSQLKDYDAASFYRAVNDVQPDLIRTEANEVTYNLHVLLRFEIEDQLVNGKIKVKDLPQVWNEKMEEYLGITPRNDAEGVLQDMHWSEGYFGYFPTYTLGTMWSAQIFNAASTAIPDLNSQIREGDFSKLKSWLNENIHQQGSLYLTDELIKRATGKPPGAEDYITYLENKFGELYDLSNL